MPLTVAEAAMPPVEVHVREYQEGLFVVSVNGKDVAHGMNKAQTRKLLSGVLLGIDACGRRVNLVSL